MKPSTNRMRIAILIIGFLAQVPAFAVPVFARQMGVGCDTCHYQHFPELNAFGRAFKLSGFTMMGSQSKIEDDSISLPDTINAGIFTNLRAQQTNGPRDDPNGNTSNNGELIIPSETSLFLGGRGGEHFGYLIEGDLPDAGIADTSFLASLKVPFIYQVGNVQVGVTVYTSGLGPAYSLELMNTGAVGNHILTLQHPAAVSAQQYVGTATDSEGIALTVNQSDWFVNYSRWSPNRLNEHAGNQSVGLDSHYLRLAYLPQVGAWDLGVGAQIWRGTTLLAAPYGSSDPNFKIETDACAIDAQAQGTIGIIPVGVYITFARAPGTDNGVPNLFGGNASSGQEAGVDPTLPQGLPNDSYAGTIAAEAGVFAHGNGTLLLALRKADNGQGPDPIDGKKYNGDDAVTLGVGYKPAQNLFINLMYTKFSGSAYDKGNSLLAAQSTGGATGPGGDQLTTLNLGIGF